MVWSRRPWRTGAERAEERSASGARRAGGAVVEYGSVAAREAARRCRPARRVACEASAGGTLRSTGNPSPRGRAEHCPAVRAGLTRYGDR